MRRDTDLPFWVALIAGTLMLIACAAGCIHRPAPDGALSAAGLARFYCVERSAPTAENPRGECSIYRAAQPTREQLAALASTYHIRTVIKLNTSLPFDGGHDDLPSGVDLIHHPWLPAGPVTPAEMQQTLDDLDAAPKPALIHCLHGEDRTGLLIGLYRVRHGAPAWAAWGEMRAYGFHASLLGLTEAFEDETGFKAEGKR